jgi:hypothetical protein
MGIAGESVTQQNYDERCDTAEVNHIIASSHAHSTDAAFQAFERCSVKRRELHLKEPDDGPQVLLRNQEMLTSVKASTVSLMFSRVWRFGVCRLQYTYTLSISECAEMVSNSLENLILLFIVTMTKLARLNRSAFASHSYCTASTLLRKTRLDFC